MYETIPTERLRRQEAAVHDLALELMLIPNREADANLLSREAKAMRDELDRRGSIVPPNA
ncbi:MAG: hypothetical protein JST16_01580 [Bdellovibrionales bacterium]|nr:hypothetical protein [Bdellovibrionales bacterium]